MHPFGQTLQALEEVGYTITHHYDDLVFPSPGDFLLQFEEDGKTLALFLPEDCPPASAPVLTSILKESFSRQKLNLKPAGEFRLDEKAEGELEVTFLVSPAK